MPVSANHIAPSTGGFEPQRAFDFQVEIVGISGSDIIQLAVQDVAWPVGRNGPITIDYFAEQRKVAGKLAFADSRITCVDYIEENVAGLLLNWRTTVIDIESGALGYATQYKKEGSIVLLGPQGDRSRVIRITGVWPASVTVDALSMTSNDVVRCAVDLVYDTAIPLF